MWRAVIKEPENLVDRILHTPVSIEEWKKQKEVYIEKNIPWIWLLLHFSSIERIGLAY